jgi:hypothetical protein
MTDGSQRGIAGTTPSADRQEQQNTSPNVYQSNRATYRPRPAGVYMPRPMGDVFVNTSSLQGIMNAGNYGSPTYNTLYEAGGAGRASNIPTYSDSSVVPHHNLFDAIAKDYHPRSTGKTWFEQFTQDALKISRTEGRYVSPVDLAYEYAMGRGLIGDGGIIIPPSSSSGGGSYGGGYGGGYSTQQTIDLTSPTQARGLLMQTIQGVLGRNPTEDEYSQFLTILNEAQTANPQVVSAAGDTVTRSGGVDPGVLALDYAQSRDDYEDVQANQYYNMFLDVLAGG